ncbi:MAG: hypothetical protein HUU60_04170 [Armatimonadetes bacterium]|nr:hypothetical protein [Armatimonadota bacterium]
MGRNLEYVMMPIGGIGTGTVWLDGQGRLAVWQVANNFTEERLPNAYFGLTANGQTRVLQSVGEGSTKPIGNLEFEGGYPIARLTFDSQPLKATLEAFNPFIPLDVENSSLPCAIFRWTLTNVSRQAARGEIFATLPNAPNPYRDETRFLPGPVHARRRDGSLAESLPMVYLDRVGWSHPQEPKYPALLAAANECIAAKGALLLANVQPEVLQSAPDWEIFDDFESEKYDGWEVAGDAFGDGPAPGTFPNQQSVTGYHGQRLVNSYRNNDDLTGRMRSRSFQIKHDYIGFLIGGGAHAGKTCINLVVDDKVARTATGRNNERLEPHEWDVRDLKGKSARLEIVDDQKGPWGHINVDRILFSNDPPAAQMRSEDSLTALRDLLRRIEVDWTKVNRNPAVRRERVSDELELDVDQAGNPVGALLRSDATVYVSLAGDLNNSEIERLLREIGQIERGAWLESGHPEHGEIAWWCDAKNAAKKDSGVAAPVSLRPGQSATFTFVLAWRYPNVDRFGRFGNRYCGRFPSVDSVVDYVRENLSGLWGWTKAYRDTIYRSNIPPEFLDSITSQAVIPRSPTCYWSEDGYFGGFEGSYGCCPLNCTHVWNYAQTHARLFPEIGRNMRRSDLITYLHEDGETSHRQHSPHDAFVDGHCAAITAAYRESLTAPDESFLTALWPRIRLAMDWLIKTFDSDESGVLRGHQWNTYDCATGGETTFLGSQYLCALAAAEQMALKSRDRRSASRYRRIRRSGSRLQSRRLFNGEYFIQIPDARPAHDYLTGCHSDQLIGQWWAEQLGLEALYPKDQIRSALKAIVKHNFRDHFRRFVQRPRRYALDSDQGLLLCTWPRGGRPDPFIIYADEVWPGMEYEVAALLTCEGMLDEARKLITAARARYDGARRDGLNSGPGGNPFNDLECGKFYARSMSSYSLLLASQGFFFDGPAGILGFAPKWQPHDHSSFFVGSEGWGLFQQKIDQKGQNEQVDLVYGRLSIKELRFRADSKPKSVKAALNGKSLPCKMELNEGVVVLLLKAQLKAGDRLTVYFQNS